MARRARVMVVTTRVLDELLDADVVPDALVGSDRDPVEHVDVEVLPWRPPLLVRTEGRSGGRFELERGNRSLRGGRNSRGPTGDAYGAGDSFAAGLTFALGSGWPVERGGVRSPVRGRLRGGRGPYAGQWDGS